MLNQVILVGRLAKEIELKELESGKKVCNITLAVPRSYKNEEGVYETDFIKCTLWQPIADSVLEYCNKGDLLGIKGRLQTRTIEKENGIKTQTQEVIGEKVTFLSSKTTQNTSN